MCALYSKPRELTPEESSRRLKVTQRALEVFGNDFDAGMWAATRPPGRLKSPLEIAEESDVGLQSALLALDDLAKIVSPQGLPESIKAARSGRRLRRKKSEFKKT